MSETGKKRLALKIILPILILAVGFFAFKSLIGMKKAPKRQQPPQLGALVDVIELQSKAHQVKVHATGTVVAEQEISIVPEVNGKVVWISPQLVGGGLFKQGETMLKIDASDYQLAVERAQADIARAEVALRTEQEKARVAMQEWNRIELPNKGVPGPLVTREIQLQQEQANLTAAKANLKQAELNLQRTIIKAPFDGRIRQEQVDLGQYLRAGSSIGTFSGTARAEIHVPLPLEELRWLSIPTSKNKIAGSLAIIRLSTNRQAQWQGKIVRSLGEIDTGSRMATIVIGIDDPYQLEKSADGPVLQNGQFVEIDIFGQHLEQIISIPREALRTGQQVWIVDTDNRLQQRPVKVLRREQQQLLLESGVDAGEKLILTTLSGAADGLLLRPVMREQAQ
ncbi:RND family efflux transporter, MFP subunit [Malonomonas rubra DSM 5091]|uniref:RND family efflux transporter, MFP subunit n=1 Tax=Malonomonas rubra DSM 5091 TaxID=1122189 RepID=A0A1M6I113_MALRU|nr:efflux RND transporter periplasmic adaptor subunit [Malonomonas rubra]SHJ28128.1 RND family efflux transporter, MFP subunit [Malonomonas rubra DSM 5091]